MALVSVMLCVVPLSQRRNRDLWDVHIHVHVKKIIILLVHTRQRGGGQYTLHIKTATFPIQNAWRRVGEIQFFARAKWISTNFRRNPNMDWYQ